MLDIPNPGTKWGDKIVIASCFTSDCGGEDGDLILAGLLLLDPNAHGNYYSVVELVNKPGEDDWGEVNVLNGFYPINNIVPATSLYQETTGCY